MKRYPFLLLLLSPILLANSCDVGGGAGQGANQFGRSGDGGGGPVNLVGLDASKVGRLKSYGVEAERLGNGSDTVIVQVTKCIGTFRIQGWMHSDSTQKQVWSVRASDVIPGWPEPVRPKAPKKDVFPYSEAVAQHEEALEQHKVDLEAWGEELQKRVKETAVDITPGFSGAGIYAFRFRLTPEAESGSVAAAAAVAKMKKKTGDETIKLGWEIRFSVRLKSSDGISRELRAFSFSDKNFPNHALGRPLADQVMLFEAK